MKWKNMHFLCSFMVHHIKSECTKISYWHHSRKWTYLFYKQVTWSGRLHSIKFVSWFVVPRTWMLMFQLKLNLFTLDSGAAVNHENFEKSELRINFSWKHFWNSVGYLASFLGRYPLSTQSEARMKWWRKFTSVTSLVLLDTQEVGK